MKKLLLFGLVAAFFCGCCSYKITESDGKDLITVENPTVKLFFFIPLVSGDPEQPNKNDCLFFCDTQLLDVNMMILDEAMKQNGFHTVKNLHSYQTQENTFFFLLKRINYQTTAELER